MPAVHKEFAEAVVWEKNDHEWAAIEATSKHQIKKIIVDEERVSQGKTPYAVSESYT